MVLSEEGADNPARLGARRVWIVDPLDGTREFGEPGRTDWAVHVALWEDGDLTAGAVALPAQGTVLSTLEPPPQPQRCDIDAVITATMSHRVGLGRSAGEAVEVSEGDEAGRPGPDPHRGEPEQATRVRSEYFRSY